MPRVRAHLRQPNGGQSRAAAILIYVRIPTGHMTNGMYGLILVDPEGGLPQVDREFYVMQGELYTAKRFGMPGHHEMDYEKLLAERPEYFVFNGSVDALTRSHPLRVRPGT